MAFSKDELKYNLFISAINVINYKIKKLIEIFIYIPSVFNKSFIINNISIFEKFNIK